MDVEHARRIIELWREDYNQVRLHSALGQVPRPCSRKPGRKAGALKGCQKNWRRRGGQVTPNAVAHGTRLISPSKLMRL